MNSYLTPVMNSYLDRLKPRIDDVLKGAKLFIIQANGGATTVENARNRAVATVNSGPAGGVVAAAWYGREHGRDRIVSVDMGGTSFDIGLVENGVSQVTTEGNFQGLPVKLPIIDLHIIGAGGGSIAWIDAGGALNVGPRSAGAEPGPACYGRGGKEATVTDANLVLGRLDPKLFHGGRTTLDVTAARAVVSRIGERLGLSVEEAALGIIKVVNANMVKGIATVTVQRGIDVREFALLSFGGAGGVHAIDLADALDMAEVVIPPLPGVFSARRPAGGRCAARFRDRARRRGQHGRRSRSARAAVQKHGGRSTARAGQPKDSRATPSASSAAPISRSSAKPMS